MNISLDGSFKIIKSKMSKKKCSYRLQTMNIRKFHQKAILVSKLHQALVSNKSTSDLIPNTKIMP